LTDELLEQVRLLSNLETDDRKLVQIVLLGQPELRDRLNNPRLRQLRQRITVRYHLLPLSRFEVSQYIQHRLDVSGA
jgi:general secretion pathway protein A